MGEKHVRKDPLAHQLRWAAPLCSALLLSVGGVALADDISNNLDSSVDATAEVMPLTSADPTGPRSCT